MGSNECDETSSRYEKPFCPEAEKRFWNDFTGRLAMKYAGIAVPQATTATLSYYKTSDRLFPVVWKRSDCGEQTGIALDGEWAGYLVSNAYQVEDERRVIIGRAITQNGGVFNPIDAQYHIKKLKLPNNQRKFLNRELKKGSYEYPMMMATILKWLEYPINTQLFVENITFANSVYLPKNLITT
jgi:hypothetical protein